MSGRRSADTLILDGRLQNMRVGVMIAIYLSFEHSPMITRVAEMNYGL